MMEFVTCFGSIAFFILLFAFFLGWRYINYVETKTLAEKGLIKADSWASGKNNPSFLTWGIIIAMIGLAITLGILPIGASTTDTMYPMGLGPWMLFGYVPLFFGLSLILVHIFTRKDNKKEVSNKNDLPVDEDKKLPPE